MNKWVKATGLMIIVMTICGLISFLGSLIFGHYSYLISFSLGYIVSSIAMTYIWCTILFS